MNHDEVIRRAQRSSRRALIATVVAFGVIAALLGRNAARLTEVQRRITAQSDTLRSLEEQKRALFEEVHLLTDAPDGGVRSAKHRVENISSELFDFFLWVDATQRSAVSIREVRYQFRGWVDSLKQSTDPRAGFAVFQRAPLPHCPDSTSVTITLANDSSATYLVDLCQAATIGSRQASAK